MDNASPITYFISDLHLCDENEDLMRLFKSFIEGPATNARALYILGDLFNFWIGDDIPTRTSILVKDLLKTLSQTVPIFFMGGNRDFLVGQDYAKSCGMNLLPEPSKIFLPNRSTPVLLVHGDSLCTQDTGYMLLRAVLRSRLGTQYFLWFPKQLRASIAAFLRKKSKQYVGHKDAFIMDVTPKAVVDLLTEYRVNTLIHGHIHKQGQHDHPLSEQQTAKRYVMADWHHSGSILQHDALTDEFHFFSFKN